MFPDIKTLLKNMVKGKSRHVFIAFNHYGHPKKTAQIFPLHKKTIVFQAKNGKKKWQKGSIFTETKYISCKKY